MAFVLSPFVRVIVVALLVFAIFVDGAGYWWRLQNHYAPFGKTQPPASAYPPNLFGWQLFVHRGLDLVGGTHLEYQMTDIPPGANAADLQQKEIAVITKRVNALGVSEPDIRAESNNRIVVELAGVSPAVAQQTIGRTAFLVYTKWVKDPNSTIVVPGTQTGGYKPQLTGLTGANITSASAGTDPTTGTEWGVSVNFDASGASTFDKLTRDNVAACDLATACPERFLAIWLDLTQNDINHWDDPGYADQLILPPSEGGKLLTNPITQTEIPGGQSFISGSFDQTSATNLATDINSGALPVNLQIIDSYSVGSTQGSDSVKQSLAAGALGLIIVVLFMGIYYRLPGLLASVALIFYAGVVLMIFKTFSFTVTLAGLAGFILSVGMAVDANVLIFERFKEEVRAGRTIGAAVEAAVGRAWPAIRDSNTSTFITSFFLALLAPGTEVQGFAVTLIVGVLTSLISSIIVTHNLLAIVLNFGGIHTGRVLGVERVRTS